MRARPVAADDTEALEELGRAVGPLVEAAIARYERAGSSARACAATITAAATAPCARW